MINNKLINFFVIFSFIGLWSSIGSDPYNFLFIFEKKNNFDLNISNINLKELINFLRAAFPLFCLLSSLLIIIKYKLFKNQKKLIYILLIVQIIQIVTTFFSKGTIVSNYEELESRFNLWKEDPRKFNENIISDSSGYFPSSMSKNKVYDSLHSYLKDEFKYYMNRINSKNNNKNFSQVNLST